MTAYSRKVSVATITLASISKYSRHRASETDPSVQEEQDNLVKDINQINRHIIETNKNRDLPTIDLACNSFTNKLKRQGSSRKRITKFTDKGLDDGLHPAHQLKHTWAKIIAKTVPRIINKLNQEEQSSAEETEDSEAETWNFKRRRSDC